MIKRPKSQKSAPLKRDVDLPVVSRPISPPDPRQARLPFDAMPSWIAPCLALLTSKVSKGEEWQYETKWDSYRLDIHVQLNGIRIITRGRSRLDGPLPAHRSNRTRI
jgi:bifunctional non-homologous end joining protein LigD